MDEEDLLAQLGVTAHAAEHIEQNVIAEASATAAAAAATASHEHATGADSTSSAALAGQLLAVQLEEEALALVINAQQEQQQQADVDDWASDDEDAAVKASECSALQLELAVSKQRLDALHQQQQHLQQHIAGLPADQQAAITQQLQQQKLVMQQQQQPSKKGRTALQDRHRGSFGSGRGRLKNWQKKTDEPQFPGWYKPDEQQQQQQQQARHDLDCDFDAFSEAAGLGHSSAAGASAAAAAAGPRLVETERDRLIRTGVLTPFDRLEGFERKVQGGGEGAAQRVQQVRFGAGAGQAPAAAAAAVAAAAATTRQRQAQLTLLDSRRQQRQQQQTQDQQRVGAQQQQQHQQHEPQAAAAAVAAGGPSCPPAPKTAAATAPSRAVDEQWALLQRHKVAPGDAAAAADAARTHIALIGPDLADIAHKVGRSGIPLPELLTKTSQKTVELGVTNRPRAVLMEPDQVPKQERELIKVNPMLWKAGAASAAGAPLAKRPPRRSTLPRQQRTRKNLAALAAAVHGAADGSGSGRKRERQQQQQRGQGTAGSSEDEWESDSAGEDDSTAGEGEDGAVHEMEQDPAADAITKAQTSGPVTAAAAAAATEAAEAEGPPMERQPQAESGGEGAVKAASRHKRRRKGTSQGEGDEEEYLPSDVDVSTYRRRRRRSEQAAAAPAGEPAPGASRGGKKRRLKKGSSISGRAGSKALSSSENDAAAAPACASAPAESNQDLLDSDDSELLELQAAAENEGSRDAIADYDDVDEGVYQLRMARYQQQLEVQQHQAQKVTAAPAAAAGGVDAVADADADGIPHEADAAAAAAAAAAVADVVFDGGFKVPGALWAQLFDYQRTGVKWLWELHTQRAGGIIGDEMGLGKTIQVIAYLAGLHNSGMWRPSLVVAPATVLRQWMSELRTWYPPLRVMLLHDSGRCPYGTPRPDKAGILEAALAAADCSVVLTTYDQLRLNRDLLLPVRWGVAVLDEGHKIRNPDAEMTLAAKQLQTVHRIIMSGSPIQNRLSELWSLFDFIFPGKLGTLPVFTAQFAVPITIGGYTNASKLQVQTAYRCAVVLRDLISPYLLRRRKADVATQLPKKTETVLFCNLTQQQRDLYRAYINSTDVAEILAGQRQALAGIDVLRKICNHPDLLERESAQGNADYGDPSRSGKLTVLSKVLGAWQAEGHKVLLFTQTQQMLDILEKLAVAAGYSYHRMDGSTPIPQRGRLMDDFNQNPDRFLFLLTTKVGGLGVNLTGANRVIIYDPDWNPSTDSQARERAWRIGQGRPVTIYRLITGGTIEEKVYHRQIYKSFLTNKVLQDPRQRRFFASRDISDLFTLTDEHGGNSKSARRGGSAAATAAAAAAGPAATETGRIFSEIVGEQVLAPAVVAPQPQMQQRRHANGMSGSSRVKKFGSRQQQQQEESFEEGELPQPPTTPATAHSSKHTQPNAAGGGGGSTAATAATAAAGSWSDKDDEASVLRDLFEGTGIKSLMDHSSIEGANNPEVLKDDQHAAKVAAAAAEVLRQSRLACQQAAVHVPTWTGRHGAAGLHGAAALGVGRANSSSSNRSSPAAATGSGGSRGRFGQVRNPLLAAAQPLLCAADGGRGNAGAKSAEGSPARTDKEDGAARSSSRAFASRQAGAVGGTAPSSAALLARMRERRAAAAGQDLLGPVQPLQPQQQQQQQSATADGSTPSGAAADGAYTGAANTTMAVSNTVRNPAVQLADEIAKFIEGAGGCANSELLVDHFRDVLHESQMALFKQLLKRVAKLVPAASVGTGRPQSGRGAPAGKVWVLKEGYASASR